MTTLSVPHGGQQAPSQCVRLPAHIPVARYRFTARLHDPLRLQDYAGSLLRGQFGAALRHAACMTRQPACGGCPLLQSCPYTRIFEAPPPASHSLQKFSQIPNPYVIEPSGLGPVDLAAGDALHFSMVLVGDAIAQLPLVIFAWQRALGQGLTRQRCAAELTAVEWQTPGGELQTIWRHDAPQLTPHDAVVALLADLQTPPRQIDLHIHTPLRLQQQGRPLDASRLTPRTLVAAVARRAALLMEFHANLPAFGAAVAGVVKQAETLSDQRELRWHDWTRYSSRQQQEMTLGGVVGRWTLSGAPEALAAVLPWLWLGQWLHVGKNATMGMGGYSLESIDA